MSTLPYYFDKIREGASRRWDQLDADPELAAPWHQLFKQVQSPRHVLSELMQNADDAGATAASLRIESGVFIFEHNGEDFIEAHFASLCRFGYSNKRALHTIGFRGIGFKSTFSVGDQVELHTPTLSVSFNKQRFTEPSWIGHGIRQDGMTCIRVVIGDQFRQLEVEKNLQEWLKSPTSLLFFKNIRRLQLGDKEVHWERLGDGPVPDSEWLVLHDNPDEEYLLVRSIAENFPEEPLAEIRQERMLSLDEETDFPPCKIEILLGAKGRLFVVLPTGVETSLPFACNAPFVQDPARLKIKDPDISPTNRWLLERAGKLAASTMLSWLQQAEMTPVDRARAYGFLPDTDRDSDSLTETCRSIITNSFAKSIEGKKILLTNDGELTLAKQSIMLPKELFSIWSSSQLSGLIWENGLPALTRHVETMVRRKLLKWKLVDDIGKEKFVTILQSKHPPKPRSWQQLLQLWSYLAPEVTDTWRYRTNPTYLTSLRLVPVIGKEALYSVAEIVDFSGKQSFLSESDWEFLSPYLIMFDHKWTKYLHESRSVADEQKNTVVLKAVEATFAIMKLLGLDESSDVSKVIDRVSSEIFTQNNVDLDTCIRLAQISAKIGATVGNHFQYVVRSGTRMYARDKVLLDEDGTLELFVPAHFRESCLLHPAYTRSFTSCSAEEWQCWVRSGRSSLLQFIPFTEQLHNIYRREKIILELRKRGAHGEASFQYRSDNFVIKDWDFTDVYWSHWENLSIEDDQIWGRIVERIIAQPEGYWSTANEATALQVASTRSKNPITSEPLAPSWIIRLREKKCLCDTRGFHHKPADLMRRTPETEALIDVEPFVNARIDREATRPLLDLLGVRSVPASPDRLLDCLRALSKSENPPIHEVEKWCRRLDQLIETCSSADLQNIKQAFQAEKIILTAGGCWATSAAVFLAADDEDVPGVEVIRSSMIDLSIWGKVGVAERPTFDLALRWLYWLPSGQPLSQDDARRVRALLNRHPVRIWEESGYWLNLAGEWVSVDKLVYSLTMQSLVAWGHLHDWVKQKTANLRFLSSETAMTEPFSRLLPLACIIEERLHRKPHENGSPDQKPWLKTLGDELVRIVVDDEAETDRIRGLASDLADTLWQDTPGLEIIPYLDGIPAGTPRRADVVWLGRVLYVEGMSKAKLAKKVPDEIGKHFNRSDIKDALVYSFDRSPEDILSYMEENFNLAPRKEITQIEVTDTASPRESGPPTPLEVDVIDTSHKMQPLQSDERHDFTEPEPSLGDCTECAQVDPEPAEVDACTKPLRADKSQKPNIIELFALSQGFSKESDDRFFRGDGCWLAKTSNGSRFPWELRTATGSIISYYWLKDHCLEQHPLQIDADIWGMIDSSPNIYTIVLADADGKPVAMPGTSLLDLKEEGKLKLYPATYRLVVE